MGTNTINKVIVMVPSDYSEVLLIHLNRVAEIIEKLCVACATLAKWQKHQGSGIYPSFVAVKPLTLVLLKNFLTLDKAVAHQATIANSHKEYLDLLLNNAI